MLNKKLQIIAKHYCAKLFAKQTRNTRFLLRCLSTQPPTATQQTCHPALSYIHYIGKEPLVYRNVGRELERAVAEYGNTEAIVSFHEDKRLDFRNALAEADRLAASLLKLGLKRGDHVGIWSPNNMIWYQTMLGVARAGLISVGINPAFQGPEVAYCLNKVHVKAIIAPEHYRSQHFYEILSEICPELASSKPGKIKSKSLPHLRAVIIETESKLPGAMRFDDLLGLSAAHEAREIATLQKLISPDSPCNVQFTSGTTGHPKAAMLTHSAYVNNAIHIGNRNQLSGQRICVQVPLFHAYGTVITIMGAMSHGATVVMPAPGFNPEQSLRAIVAEKCTVIHGTPTMYVDLIKKQRELKLPLKTAKMAITGGAPCSPQLFMDIKNVLGLEHVRTVFGMTEATAVIFQSRPGDSMEQVLNTVGHIQDHIEAKVIDAEGNTVPFGQPGELCVRGYGTMLGYYDDDAKTKETIGADRWLKTGDQFVLQEDGYGRICGRLKEMVIRGGENIFPKEVEDFLNTHPQIIESHVIGVPDERMGEELCAFVRLEDGVESLTRDDIKEFSKGKFAHFKVPRYVVTTKDFPKTTSGKIQKFKLQEQFKQQQKL